MKFIKKSLIPRIHNNLFSQISCISEKTILQKIQYLLYNLSYACQTCLHCEVVIARAYILYINRCKRNGRRFRFPLPPVWDEEGFRFPLPPVWDEEGSTASTATLWPLAVRNFPNASINVLFPAPGGPDNPVNNEHVLFVQNVVMREWMTKFVTSHL